MARKTEHEEGISDPIASTYYAYDPQRVTIDLREWLEGDRNMDKQEREEAEKALAEARETFREAVKEAFPEYTDAQVETYIKGR